MTVADVFKELDEALEQFGTYNYYDKGVDEVFEAGMIVDHVKTLSEKDAVAFLIAISKHKHGEHLVDHIVMCCDNAPQKWFDDVVKDCRAAGLNVY